MLKITKGMKPFIEEGISTYTDTSGNKYVRVTADGEDFCIASHDYIKDGQYEFTWNDAMKSLEVDGLSMLNSRQLSICVANKVEINNKLKEIGGNTFEYTWCWTSTDIPGNYAGVHYGYSNIINTPKDDLHSVRPILNLK